MERAVRVTIQVNHIRIKPSFQFQKPFAGIIDILPGRIHPFESEFTFGKLYIRQPLHLRALIRSRRFTHGREQHVDLVLREHLAKLHRVRPDASNGVGRHQNATGSNEGRMIHRQLW